MVSYKQYLNPNNSQEIPRSTLYRLNKRIKANAEKISPDLSGPTATTPQTAHAEPSEHQTRTSSNATKSHKQKDSETKQQSQKFKNKQCQSSISSDSDNSESSRMHCKAISSYQTPSTTTFGNQVKMCTFILFTIFLFSNWLLNVSSF